uniref:Golgin subfamily A member 7/ERF4 domain-containing protein n=1 Tax=Eutreptiella gymnastica TaxID=73025 RepID=A0A7S4LMB1_9EUGL
MPDTVREEVEEKKIEFKFKDGYATAHMGDVDIDKNRYSMMTPKEQRLMKQGVTAGACGCYCCICTLFLSWIPYKCCYEKKLKALTEKYKAREGGSSGPPPSNYPEPAPTPEVAEMK